MTMTRISYAKTPHRVDVTRPGKVRLRRLGQRVVPDQTPSLFRSMLRFARFMGLRSIPAATMERLAQDPSFILYFAELKERHEWIYHPTIDFYWGCRKRLLTILRDPQAATETDFCFAVDSLMDNFRGHLPGGTSRKVVQLAISQTTGEIEPHLLEAQRVFDTIDRLLADRGLADEAVSLRRVYRDANKPDEQLNPDKIAFVKLCWELFNVLVDDYGFSSKSLSTL